MSANSVIRVVGEPEVKAVLINLIEKMKVVHHDQTILTDEKKSIIEDAKKIGLSPKEFNDIVKYVMDEELCYNALATIECIADNLLSTSTETYSFKV